jgi:hypothetical protein
MDLPIRPSAAQHGDDRKQDRADLAVNLSFGAPPHGLPGIARRRDQASHADSYVRRRGAAHVGFHVNAFGAIVGISASGSSPAHAALERRIVTSVHAPPPGVSFFGVQNFIFD